MREQNPVFDEHYQNYLNRLSAIDIETVCDRLGILRQGNGCYQLPFFTDSFHIAKGSPFTDNQGNPLSYPQLVIMARYLLNCPESPHEDNNWVSFKDFKLVSHFTNVNYFKTDTEQAIARSFSGKKARLAEAGLANGGTQVSGNFTYDLALQFRALPKISLLLLFNDEDQDFPATCAVLFPKHAEWYLDPEALAMTSAYLASRLRKSQ